MRVREACTLLSSAADVCVVVYLPRVVSLLSSSHRLDTTKESGYHLRQSLDALRAETQQYEDAIAQTKREMEMIQRETQMSAQHSHTTCMQLSTRPTQPIIRQICSIISLPTAHSSPFVLVLLLSLLCSVVCLFSLEDRLTQSRSEYHWGLDQAERIRIEEEKIETILREKLSHVNTQVNDVSDRVHQLRQLEEEFKVSKRCSTRAQDGYTDKRDNNEQRYSL